jgi:hypothetical protein
VTRLVASTLLVATLCVGIAGSAFAAPQNAVAAATDNLQQELSALQLMNEAIGPARAKSQARIQQMKAFVAEKGLAAEYKAFSPENGHPPLTFQQAYQAALEQQSLHGKPAGGGEDLATLQREVAATTSMVQEAWKGLNSNLATVHAMSSFLASKGLMDEYVAWSRTYEADRKRDEAATIAKQRSAADAAAKQQADARDKALAALQQRMDKMHYVSTGIDYNYQFSQGVRPGSQTGDRQFSQGVAPGSQMGYYGGSYYNGYADPYYDIWWDNTHLNFPAGSYGQNLWNGYYPEFGRAGLRNWSRSHRPVYRPAAPNGGAGPRRR